MSLSNNLWVPRGQGCVSGNSLADNRYIINRFKRERKGERKIKGGKEKDRFPRVFLFLLDNK